MGGKQEEEEEKRYPKKVHEKNISMTKGENQI